MSMLTPVWLLLLIPTAALLYIFRPPTRMLTIIRTATLLLIILAMCRIMIKLPGRNGTIVVVADRSSSMRTADLKNQEEVIKLLGTSLNPGEKFAVVAFGRDAVIEHPPQAGAFAGFTADCGKDQSNLGVAIEKALSLIPRNAGGRILLLSDGRLTGISPYAAAGKAAARDIGIDYRLQSKPLVNDLAIDRIAVPEHLLPAESFMLTAWIHSPIAQNVSYELVRGTTKLAAGKRRMQPGLNKLVFRDHAKSSGTQQYRLTVSGEKEDPRPENNRAAIMIGIRGSKPLLCVSGTKQHNFSSLLQAGGVNLKTISPENTRWTLAELSNYSGVILENVAANHIGDTGMEMISAWIEDSGSGLMMTGGRNAFGPGGYFRSPLERILPISMELKKEHRKFNLAIVVVMDRSGSMGASAGGGKTKMDLANIGTVQVLDLLTDQDEIGVIAVDSTAHTITPLATVEQNRSQRERILKIESMGGGIYIYEALKAATRMLLKAEAETRHIILFADAADSEVPGKYIELLAKCEAANITCSVIGLGTERDCDATLLRDIARMGAGQCFFSENALEIPRLFAQDTFSVSRSALVTDPVKINFTAGYNLLADRLPQGSPTIGGYNLCYIRENANPAAITTDEYKAPIIATWQVGRGRTLCYMAEADGEYTGAISKWSQLGNLYSGMARWTAGNTGQLPEGIMQEQTIDDGVCRIKLHLDPDRKSTPFNSRPYLNLLHGNPGTKPQRDKLNFKWIAADTLAAEFQLYGSETALPTIHIEGQPPLTLSPVCLPYSPEFRPPQPGCGLETLSRLARITGGRECGDISTIHNSLPHRARMIEISLWLYISAALMLLTGVLQRRTGILSNLKKPQFKKISINLTRNQKTVKPPKPKQEKESKQKPAAPPKSKPAKSKPEENTLSALQEARRRAKRRNRR